jgi:hypothetical protein
MSKSLTASDRSALIKLAHSLEKGSDERKAILAGLKKASFAATRPPTSEEMEDLGPKARRALESYLGRNFRITNDPRNADQVDFVEDNPRAPGSFKEDGVVWTFGSDMDSGKSAVQAESKVGYGTWYFLER